MTLETEFAEVLAVIATSLGIAAERIFGIFVEAQAMIGIIDVCCVIVAAILAYLSWKYTLKICVLDGKDEEGDWKSDDDEVSSWIWPVACAIVVFFVAWGLTDIIGDAVLKIACPEYTAMKEIIQLVR